MSLVTEIDKANAFSHPINGDFPLTFRDYEGNNKIPSQNDVI